MGWQEEHRDGISRFPTRITDAHKHASNHRAEIESSELCGCFYCQARFPPAEILDWVDDDDDARGTTALCPRCGIDSVLGDSSGFAISPGIPGRNAHVLVLNMSPPIATAQVKATVHKLAMEAQQALDELYERPGQPPADSALDQAGLRDGAEVVADYLEHNELGLAFEHLLYMLVEPEIEVTHAQFDDIETVGRSLGLKPALWQRVRCGE